jgi:NAD(P)-dependent dehydrogenase (short-subunit alcohol dehydrogenase family)
MTVNSVSRRVAIVTGAAGGFGRILVRRLLDAGASVSALDVDRRGLEALSHAHAADEDRLLIQQVDIADYTQCARSVSQTIDKLGGIHILINNAALGMGTIRADHMQKLVGIREITPQTWQRFVAVNFSGSWNMTRAAIDHLLAQRWGRIIYVTTSFFTMLRGGFHPYGPCKAGLEAMAAGHAQELTSTGVTVNVVVPGGPADTPMVPAESGFDRKKLVAPEVMAPPILWLCSEEAEHITGNRYVAAHWNTELPPAEAERTCRAPIAWPELAQAPVWPGGKPAH